MIFHLLKLGFTEPMKKGSSSQNLGIKKPLQKQGFKRSKVVVLQGFEP